MEFKGQNEKDWSTFTAFDEYLKDKNLNPLVWLKELIKECNDDENLKGVLDKIPSKSGCSATTFPRKTRIELSACTGLLPTVCRRHLVFKGYRRQSSSSSMLWRRVYRSLSESIPACNLSLLVKIAGKSRSIKEITQRYVLTTIRRDSLIKIRIHPTQIVLTLESQRP